MRSRAGKRVLEYEKRLEEVKDNMIARKYWEKIRNRVIKEIELSK